MFRVQLEDGHYQGPKLVVVHSVENILYSTNKYTSSCVRRVHTLYISYFIEHNGDEEPHDYRCTNVSNLETAVAQWLRCCATNRKVAGSNPAGVSGFFIDIKSFRSHYGPGVDSSSNRNKYQEYFLGVKATGV